MKRLISVICLLLCLSSYSQVAEKTSSWYKCMKGTIGKYPITIHLHKWGHSYSGYYYYDRSQEPIDFSGTDTSRKGLVLTAYLDAEGDDVETFTGRLNGNIYEGSWQKSGKHTPLSFKLNVYDNPGAPKFSFVYTEGTKKLRPKLKNSPEASYVQSSVWPLDKSDSSSFIRRVLIEAFGGVYYYSTEIGMVLLENKKQFFDEYISEFKDQTDKDFQSDPYSYAYSTSTDFLIVYSDSSIMSLSSTTYSYTGGAHGNYGTSFYAFDVKHKKRLTLSDVIEPGDSTQLNIVLEEKLRKKYHLKPTDKLSDLLFENYIKANDNFYITRKGIGFNYTPYEIAAYAFGEVRLFIPFSEIRSLLKEGFLESIKPIN